MSSSVQQDKTIFLTDSMNMIKSKVNKYAFSGARGKGDKADTEKYGVDLDKDVPYQYLTFFLHDQKKLDEIKEKYAVGQMLTGEVKKVLIDVLQELVQGHQTRKAA